MTNRVLGISAAFLLLCSLICAQSFVGGVRGLVQDPGGATIANANVTLRNDATGTVRTTISNSQGEYAFSQVEPATYVLVVENPGFKKLERRGVIIGTQEQIKVDLKMELGEVSQSVEVTSAVPLIENATASNGQVLNTQQMEDLPNLGRNTFLMSKLTNNVVPSGPPQWNRFQDQIGSSALSIAGGPIRGNNYLVDGVPITSSQNLAMMIPSQSAVQEMKLQENTYDASMGRTGGGVFNTVIRTGTNGLHGDVLGYLRTTDLTANNFFNNAAGVPRQSEKWENWEMSLGGPVFIPKVYNGKNKTFFFVSTEGYLENQPDFGGFTLPTAAELGGNFNGSGKVIYDPLSGRACQPSDNCPAGATVIRTPLQNNTILPGQMSQIGKAILGYLPPANIANAAAGSNNYQGSDTLGNHAEEFIYKLEEDPTSWLRLNASFLYYKSFEPGSNALNNLPGSGSYLLYRHVDATAVNAIVSVNPTTVITARYGFNRFPNIYNYPSFGFDQTKLGFPASYVNQLQIPEFPGISLAESGTSFGGGTHQQIYYWSKNASVVASKFVGKHNISAGFDYRLIHTDGAQFPSGFGSFTFNGIFSQQFNAGTSATTGSDFADILLGYPSAGSVGTNVNTAFFVKYYSGYVQDDIRVTNRLTINIGLRYEYETGEAEKNNNMLVGFDRTAVNPIQAGVPAGAGVIAYGLPLIAGQNGNPNSCCNALKDKFGPRLGFAFQINDKTTFRGGWGIFYAPVYFSLDNQYSPGLSQTTTYLASTDGFATPANSLSNPYPGGILQPGKITQGVLQQYGSTLTFADQARTQGRVQQFSADLQRQLPWGVAAEIGYVGSRSSNLQFGSTGSGLLPINQIADQNLSLGAGLTKKVANPFYQLPGVGGALGGSTVSQAQLLSPFPEYASVLASTNLASAQYDSMILKAQKRMSQGATFLSTFTWARNYDNEFGSGTSNYYNSGVPVYPQDVYNLNAEWALGAGTVPWRFTSGFSYDLPFGKGKPFANHNRFLDYAAGGWSINGTMIVQSGFPLQVWQNNTNSGAGALAQRPNATGQAATGSGTPESRLYNYINPGAFSLAPQYTFGNLARNIPNYGPGLANWDLSLFKTFTVMERFHGQFRAEALNAFNTPNFNNPNGLFLGTKSDGTAVGNFGRLLSQANLPRELQLGIRLYF